ncbi:carboxypeptidase-like regulatory domain-containing protein [Polaribacter sp. MSW13]|uniref:Carboxypeptidase-like regulatory domain-containing protein n=1 Tax=Polaribacter marinus TaxID=2916838 RepID=A0A9X2AMD8_9FLAO|nr:carboxypeptidase-like regulatory domain-containing protein [Polaribacter marinus]MCI2228764.1 carboxypeptidase-like regulatory domain-containing protein [Polaribacter marinus]
MKNRFFLILLILINANTSAQFIIKGKVLSSKKVPLEGAAVYFNNSMIGTTTNADGEFLIKTKEGQYELIASYLGYKTVIFPLNTTEIKKSIVFILKEDENTLDEIIIRKTKYDTKWKYNLETFKRAFIGITKLSKNCEILNPKVLHFEFDPYKNILTAFAKRPLKIKHKDLGYFITYDLVSFVKTGNYVTVTGYSRYQNLKGSKRKQKGWKKNRRITYNGSTVHFFKSVINNKIEEEGFIVHQFKRIKNLERPSEIEIKKARKFVKLSRATINFSKNLENPKNAIDSALVVLRKVKLPKFKDYLYKSKLKSSELFKIDKGVVFLNFKDNLSIVYTKEKEEKAYILRNAFSKIRDALPQTSSLIPLNMPLALDRLGVLIHPLDVLYEGYWSYEKFADSLPLDYEPGN